MKYERLTGQEWSENIELTRELGYSYIYKRLYELENKIEQGTLKEINDKLIGEGVYGIHKDTTGKYWCDDDEHILLGFTSDGIVTWNDNHGYNDYFKDGLWFFTREEAEKRLKELQECLKR